MRVCAVRMARIIISTVLLVRFWWWADFMSMCYFTILVSQSMDRYLRMEYILGDLI